MIRVRLQLQIIIIESSVSEGTFKGPYFVISLLHHLLEVTVCKAVMQFCVKILGKGKSLLFLHDLMQFVSAWKTICPFVVSMWKRPELSGNLLICHGNELQSNRIFLLCCQKYVIYVCLEYKTRGHRREKDPTLPKFSKF